MFSLLVVLIKILFINSLGGLKAGQVLFSYITIEQIKRLIYNVIKVAHRYAVQVSDTTKLTIAAALFGQKYIVAFTVIMICD